jgi:hypothetical protein
VDNSEVTVPFINVSLGLHTYCRLVSGAESKLLPIDQTRSPGLSGSNPK